MNVDPNGALAAIIEKLSIKIGQLERQLEDIKQDCTEARDLIGGRGVYIAAPSVVAKPKRPELTLVQAVLLAVQQAGEDGCQFNRLLNAVERLGIQSNLKTVRATAHRCQKLDQLAYEEVGKRYRITAAGVAKLPLLPAGDSSPKPAPAVPPKPDKLWRNSRLSRR